jgi:hypothetical protein
VWWMIRGRKLGIRDLEARALRKIDFMIGMHDALFVHLHVHYWVPRSFFDDSQCTEAHAR